MISRILLALVVAFGLTVAPATTAPASAADCKGKVVFKGQFGPKNDRTHWKVQKCGSGNRQVTVWNNKHWNHFNITHYRKEGGKYVKGTNGRMGTRKYVIGYGGKDDLLLRVSSRSFNAKTGKVGKVYYSRWRDVR